MTLIKKLLRPLLLVLALALVPAIAHAQIPAQQARERVEELDEDYKLGEAQKKQILEIFEKLYTDIAAVRADTAIGKKERDKKIRNLTAVAYKQLPAIFTPEQREIQQKKIAANNKKPSAASKAAPAQDDSDSWVLRENGFTPLKTRQKRSLNTPVCRLPDGRLMAQIENALVFSTDNMTTWGGKITILDPEARKNHTGRLPEGGVLHVTSQGNWVVGWRDKRTPDSLSEFWHPVKNEPVAEAAGHVWTIYSSDQGKTWSKPDKILAEPGGYPPKQMIETKNGVLIMPTQYHARGPGRNVIVIMRSTDQGKTWERVPPDIDMGGCGHHDGALEPTLVQLNNGVVWLLFRTTTDRLWQCFSADDGKTWTKQTPSNILSSSSPPIINRLKSGKLLLMWNPWQSSTGAPPPMRGGDKFFTEKPTSWHRQEMILATSADEGKTWSKPLIIARHPKIKGWISYPYFFETDDGNLFVFSGQGGVQASIPVSKLP